MPPQSAVVQRPRDSTQRIPIRVSAKRIALRRLRDGTAFPSLEVMVASARDPASAARWLPCPSTTATSRGTWSSRVRAEILESIRQVLHERTGLPVDEFDAGMGALLSGTSVSVTGLIAGT
jgi:hypothetical protein